ncbi:protein of unknown function [Streptomyces sp. KY70]|nr:protein of unknown function [Streptomyces sp. KY70]
MTEPRVEVLAGVDPVGSEEAGDGVGRRDLLRVLELHGHGEVFRGEPALEATHRSRIRPARLQMAEPRSESRLVVAPGLEADVTDDSAHVSPSAGLRKRTAAKQVLNVVGEPLGRTGCGHGSMMALRSDCLAGKFRTSSWVGRGGAVPSDSPSTVGRPPIRSRHAGQTPRDEGSYVGPPGPVGQSVLLTPPHRWHPRTDDA